MHKKKAYLKLALFFISIISICFISDASIPTAKLAAKTSKANNSKYTARVRPVLQATMEAPARFDNQTNGLVDQATHDTDRMAFEAINTVEMGLGPLFEANSCAVCHSNPITGGNSQIRNLRAGNFDGKKFTDHPGGSLIHSQSTCPGIQSQVLETDNVRTFRRSLSLLGLGFVEAISDKTLLDIAKAQSQMSGGRINGQAAMVPVLEAPGKMQVGRFGWKDTFGSLETFSGFAYVAEIGLTTPIFPNELTSDGNAMVITQCEMTNMAPSDPEQGEDANQTFAQFIRATKVPPRDEMLAATTDAQAGAQLFNNLGCAICHVPSITTAPAGSLVNGGAFTVPPELGDKVIRPFSDFLLHDIGTGDGIVENGDQSTRNKLRTSPLWGLRTQNQFMHDGLSVTTTDAILRHAGESKVVTKKFRKLSDNQKQQLITFLKSL
jgi:CxxC motif-containing protein (DUF1111 family)